MNGLFDPARWLHLDWVLVVVAGWLLVGLLGLFALRNIPEEHLQPFLLAEAPRILFPFARRVIADAVQDGGFAPLYLEPIDEKR